VPGEEEEEEEEEGNSSLIRGTVLYCTCAMMTDINKVALGISLAASTMHA
jgi:hypothetical protein